MITFVLTDINEDEEPTRKPHRLKHGESIFGFLFCTDCKKEFEKWDESPDCPGPRQEE